VCAIDNCSHPPAPESAAKDITKLSAEELRKLSAEELQAYKIQLTQEKDFHEEQIQHHTTERDATEKAIKTVDEQIALKEAQEEEQRKIKEGLKLLKNLAEKGIELTKIDPKDLIALFAKASNSSEPNSPKEIPTLEDQSASDQASSPKDEEDEAWNQPGWSQP